MVVEGYLKSMMKPKLCMHIFTLLLIMFFFYKINAQEKVSEFVFGAHVTGEQLSYVWTGSIPAFQPVFTLNTTPEDPHLEKRFTYLKVEYINPVSRTTVLFDDRTLILKIYQKYPFVSMALGVHGFSMPIDRENN